MVPPAKTRGDPSMLRLLPFPVLALAAAPAALIAAAPPPGDAGPWLVLAPPWQDTGRPSRRGGRPGGRARVSAPRHCRHSRGARLPRPRRCARAPRDRRRRPAGLLRSDVMTQIETFDDARQSAARTLVWISWALLPIVCLAAWIAGTPVWLAGRHLRRLLRRRARGAARGRRRSPGSPPRRPSSASRSP